MSTRSTTAVRAAATIVLLVLSVGCSTSGGAADGSSGAALGTTSKATATAGSDTADGSLATDGSSSANASTTANASTVASDSASDVNSTPAQEGTGAESPQAPKRGGPSISVASLPVGGNVDVDGARQCGHVNLITHDQLPPGISISIDSIGLSRNDVFTVQGDPCGSAPPCATSWTWTTDTAGSECTVAITQIAQVPDSSYSAALVLGGTVGCLNQDACNQVQRGFDGNGSGTQIIFEASTDVVATDSASASASASASSGGSTAAGS